MRALVPRCRDTWQINRATEQIILVLETIALYPGFLIQEENLLFCYYMYKRARL